MFAPGCNSSSVANSMAAHMALVFLADTIRLIYLTATGRVINIRLRRINRTSPVKSWTFSRSLFTLESKFHQRFFKPIRGNTASLNKNRSSLLLKVLVTTVILLRLHADCRKFVLVRKFIVLWDSEELCEKIYKHTGIKSGKVRLYNKTFTFFVFLQHVCCFLSCCFPSSLPAIFNETQ